MKKLLFFVAGVYLAVNVNAQIATSVQILDTRSENNGPNTYRFESKFDFKLRETVGVPGSGGYSGMLTIAPWGDNSGDKNHQLNFNNGGIFYRTGWPQNTTWEAWRKLILEDTNGNLGLGTTSVPIDKLQIGDFNNTNNYKINIPGVYNFEQIRLGQYGNGACGLEFINHTGLNTSGGVRFSSDIDRGVVGLQIQTANSASSLSELNYITRLSITNTGFIGIGGAPIDNRKVMIYGSDNTPSGIALDVKNLGGEDILSCNNDASVNIGYSSTLNVLRNGNVGIGTTDPQAKLHVNGDLRVDGQIYHRGTLKSQEIKVEIPNGTWKDYVFHPSYKLKSLTEVEQYIQTNGHLPEIPSTKEVEQNGVNVGEMQAKLLQKVEELTLYVIELKKENEEIKKELKKIKE
jgi:hypothetical protein